MAGFQVNGYQFKYNNTWEKIIPGSLVIQEDTPLTEQDTLLIKDHGSYFMYRYADVTDNKSGQTRKRWISIFWQPDNEVAEINKREAEKKAANPQYVFTPAPHFHVYYLESGKALDRWLPLMPTQFSVNMDGIETQFRTAMNIASPEYTTTLTLTVDVESYTGPLAKNTREKLDEVVATALDRPDGFSEPAWQAVLIELLRTGINVAQKAPLAALTEAQEGALKNARAYVKIDNIKKIPAIEKLQVPIGECYRYMATVIRSHIPLDNEHRNETFVLNPVLRNKEMSAYQTENYQIVQQIEQRNEMLYRILCVEFIRSLIKDKHKFHLNYGDVATLKKELNHPFSLENFPVETLTLLKGMATVHRASVPGDLGETWDLFFFIARSYISSEYFEAHFAAFNEQLSQQIDDRLKALEAIMKLTETDRLAKIISLPVDMKVAAIRSLSRPQKLAVLSSDDFGKGAHIKETITDGQLIFETLDAMSDVARAEVLEQHPGLFTAITVFMKAHHNQFPYDIVDHNEFLSNWASILPQAWLSPLLHHENMSYLTGKHLYDKGLTALFKASDPSQKISAMVQFCDAYTHAEIDSFKLKNLLKFLTGFSEDELLAIILRSDLMVNAESYDSGYFKFIFDAIPQRKKISFLENSTVLNYFYTVTSIKKITDVTGRLTDTIKSLVENLLTAFAALRNGDVKAYEAQQLVIEGLFDRISAAYVENSNASQANFFKALRAQFPVYVKNRADKVNAYIEACFPKNGKSGELNVNTAYRRTVIQSVSTEQKFILFSQENFAGVSDKINYNAAFEHDQEALYEVLTTLEDEVKEAYFEKYPGVIDTMAKFFYAKTKSYQRNLNDFMNLPEDKFKLIPAKYRKAVLMSPSFIYPFEMGFFDSYGSPSNILQWIPNDEPSRDRKNVIVAMAKQFPQTDARTTQIINCLIDLYAKKLITEDDFYEILISASVTITPKEDLSLLMDAIACMPADKRGEYICQPNHTMAILNAARAKRRDESAENIVSIPAIIALLNPEDRKKVLNVFSTCFDKITSAESVIEVYGMASHQVKLTSDSICSHLQRIKHELRFSLMMQSGILASLDLSQFSATKGTRLVDMIGNLFPAAGDLSALSAQMQTLNKIHEIHSSLSASVKTQQRTEMLDVYLYKAYGLNEDARMRKFAKLEVGASLPKWGITPKLYNDLSVYFTKDELGAANLAVKEESSTLLNGRKSLVGLSGPT